MKTLINLSVKKTATSFLHNLFRRAGIRVAPEKEYYIIPRKTKGFFNLHNNVMEAYDEKRQTYFSANETSALDEYDQAFLEQLLSLNRFTVDYIGQIKHPFDVALASIQRLDLLRQSYPESELFVVSDPNFLTDFWSLAIAMDESELQLLTSLLAAYGIEFFSVLRNPVDTALSFAALYSKEVQSELLYTEKYLNNIVSRCQQGKMIQYLSINLGVVTRAYTFDFVTGQPLNFLSQFRSDFGIEKTPPLQTSDLPANPNPGAVVDGELRNLLRDFFSNRLEPELVFFNAFRDHESQGAIL